jgi:predicted nuclease of restriction endonuclease-like (RecB) superfamily
LTHQIESNLYQRQGKAISNFQATLPAPHSDLANQTLKDPYIFDFLSLTESHNEKELENALVEHVTRFLLELGAGFSYLGKQYKLEISGDEFFIDLLFYHVKLHCYVVVELKTGKFKPEFAGQLNFYVSAVDSVFKSEADNATIGILICKSKNNTVVEYTLKGIQNPIGVSEYSITKSLPDEFKSSLPSIEAIEAELGE